MGGNELPNDIILIRYERIIGFLDLIKEMEIIT